MSGKGVNRRDFLKVLGLGGSTAALSGCGNTSIESGAELVESYVQPEDFVVPGVGVYYASACTQCSSGCGVMGRVREGRILKLEGNPGSRISSGKICGLGQAAVQAHYNPDRLTTPMLNDRGALTPISWDKAMAMLNAKLGPASGLAGDQIAFLTGETSGHQQALLRNYLDSFGSTHHVAYDALSRAVGMAVSKQMLGVEHPLVHIDKARLILSFGDDFLGTGVSPLSFAAQYARFRKAPRGTLVQIEPRMTLTGANADRWIAIVPGTEGILALGLVRELLQHRDFGHAVAADIIDAVKRYDKEFVSRETGVHADVIPHLAGMLWEKTPSLVLAGAAAEGHAHGSRNVAAIMLLNLVLENLGKTLQRQPQSPFPQLAPAAVSFKALADLNHAMAAGTCRALLIHGANPVFSAPNFMHFADNLKRVPFKVACVEQLDETAQQCDLVLPMLSALEDFGTHVAEYQPDGVEITIQQPLMEKLYPEARSFGDVLLDLLKQRKPESYKDFPDYYAYLKSALLQTKAAFKSSADNEVYWEDALSRGVLHLDAPAGPLSGQVKAAMLTQPEVRPINVDFPFYFIPSARAAFRDGRHANLPWLQESPDPLTTVVWDSWVDIHPKTAAEMQIREGDILEIQSASGSIKAKAYLFPGIHPDAVSVPIGQGHESFGRYASHVGVNPLKILDELFDEATGELAMYATRVVIKKTDQHERITKDEGPTTTQQGRKLVVTMAADQAALTKEVGNVDR
jgi:anaerobic selenocysteine-containing dehydrogenase